MNTADEHWTEQDMAYFKGARAEPEPWDLAGPGTAPLPVLTPPVLEQMDREREEAAPEPPKALTRLQARQERKRRERRDLALTIGGAVGFVAFVWLVIALVS